jgi:hypothetical protein
MKPAHVIRPMRHEFGIGDGRTLSVVRDMARKFACDHHNHHQHRREHYVSSHHQTDCKQQHLDGSF